MTEPTLYYMPGACALSQMICLEWIGKPYRLCRITADQRFTPEFKALNPHGAVPVMQVGERVLFESSALLLHLADANPEAKIAPPINTPERDEMYTWISYLGSRFHIAHYPVFKTARYSDREDLHEHLRERAFVQIGLELDYVNEELAGKRFAVGDSRTVVDAYFAAVGRWARKFFDYAEKCPEFDRYLNGLQDDPGVARALQIESGEIEGPDGALLGHISLT